MQGLRQAFKNGEKFVLFSGAGQNAGTNVNLLWNDLIRSACKISFRQIFQELGVSYKDTRAILKAMDIEFDKTMSSSALLRYVHTNFPVEIQVSIIKALMKDHYIPTLQSQLYSQCNYNIIKQAFSLYAGHAEKEKPFQYFRHIPQETESSGKENDNTSSQKELYTLFIIARLLLMNPQIESVITYNFDNFIRQAVKVLMKSPADYFSAKELEFLNDRFKYSRNNKGTLADRVKVIDIHDNAREENRIVDKDTIPVYHVHGYIPDPHEEEIVNSPEIVMALEEFVGQQTNGISWQDSVQVNAFHDANIIFLGCSMTDLTMKRMINLSHARGYKNKIYILAAHSYNKEKDEDRQILALENLRSWYYDKLGAIFINCPEGYTTLCDDLYDLTFNSIHKK